jgi:AmiR/NasT family two-component response regulator
MLMLVYGLGAVAAFDLLSRRSQETNVTLRRLARQIVRAVDDGGDAAAPAAN